MSSKRYASLLALPLALTASMAFAADQPAAKQEAKPAAAAADAKAPQLTVLEPIKDYGTIAKGEKLDWTFVVKNTGASDLQVLSAQPSCGCTVADFDKVIKPGQTGKVTAHVDTTAFSGPISKTVTVSTNDPNTPTAQLTIHAIVKPYVEAYPAGFVRYNLIQGETGKQTVTLYSEEEAPFEITSIEVPGEWVKASYTKIDKPEELVKAGRTGQAQYRVDLVYGGPTAKLGPIAEKVHIKTNSKHQPDYQLSISGVVRPSYSVSPTVLNFGEISATDPAAQRTVMLKSNDLAAPQLFQVTKVESSNPAVKGEAVAGEKPGEYQVKISLDKSAKAGAIESEMKIYTTDKANPVFTLPIRGEVKGAPAPASK